MFCCIELAPSAPLTVFSPVAQATGKCPGRELKDYPNYQLSPGTAATGGLHYANSY